MKSGKFIWSDKHQKFIFEGRELELDEFNSLMANSWPMQKLAHQQVSGFAFVDEIVDAKPIQAEPTIAVIEDFAPTEEYTAPLETNQETQEQDENIDGIIPIAEEALESTDEVPILIPRNPRKPRKPKD
jgi:hypothetical protein